MTKHAFLEGMGLGVLAGAAIGMAVTAKSMQLSLIHISEPTRRS